MIAFRQQYANNLLRSAVTPQEKARAERLCYAELLKSFRHEVNDTYYLALVQARIAAENEPPDDYDWTEDQAHVVCPACGADNLRDDAALGALGALIHYRCPQCGAQWSETNRED